jgi:glycosyltransferase 2 family protein
MESSTLSNTTSVVRPAWQRWVAYAGIAVFLVWCLKALWHDITQIDLRPLQAGWGAVVIAALLSLGNYLLRVVRWQMYLRRLGHRLPWRFVALTFMAGFAFTLSPGKLGEMVRARYYQPLGIPISQVTGAFFIERLLDLLVMILLAAVVLTDLGDYQSFLWVAVTLVLGLLVGVAVVPWQRVSADLSQRQLREAAPVWVKASANVAHMFASAQVFLSPGLLTVGLALGLLAWGIEAIGLKLVADVLAPGQLSVAGAMGCYAVAIIVGALSFLPGGLGSTEAVMASLLVVRGFSKPQAILLTLICRLLTLWLAVLIGWWCVWRLKNEKAN